MEKNKISRLVILLISVQLLVGCSPATKSNNLPTKTQLSNFTISDVCKAGLSSMYDQSVSEMVSDIAVDGNIRISYRRQQDGREFKYRCKLVGENIQTLDENIENARWYGASTDNSMLIYKESDASLVITDVMGSQITRHTFTLNDFSNTIANVSAIDSTQEKILDDHAKDIIKKYSFLNLKSVKKTTSDPLGYVMVFHTTSTDMLTKSDAANNSKSYEMNIKITNKWKSMFCTSDLKKIMQEKSIGMVTGIIQDSRMVDHSLAPCF